MGGGANGGGQPNINVNVPDNTPRSVLNYDTTGVTDLDNMYSGTTKRAFVVDSLARAVQGRLANSVIDELTGQPKAEEPKPSAKELEISSKYPEMAKLLEDEQNKAYLQRLLKDEA
jgi:hypothetical protein